MGALISLGCVHVIRRAEDRHATVEADRLADATIGVQLEEAPLLLPVLLTLTVVGKRWYAK